MKITEQRENYLMIAKNKATIEDVFITTLMEDTLIRIMTHVAITTNVTIIGNKGS